MRTGHTTTVQPRQEHTLSTNREKVKHDILQVITVVNCVSTYDYLNLCPQTHPLMNYTTISHGPINIIGISVRTTNKDGQSGKDIQKLWDRLLGEKLIAQIPNVESSEVYDIYTDYESDVNGPYTTILGCKVTSLDNVPEGFVSKVIPEGTYRLYENSGRLPQCVVETWNNIWQSDAERAYVADFDVYNLQPTSPDNFHVKTYLSVK